jgi:peptide/nickel transport system substrate-binding protein
MNPVVDPPLSGAGPSAWFGWPDIPQIEKLVTDCVRAIDQTKHKQLADEIQKVARPSGWPAPRTGGPDRASAHGPTASPASW